MGEEIFTETKIHNLIDHELKTLIGKYCSDDFFLMQDIIYQLKYSDVDKQEFFKPFTATPFAFSRNTLIFASDEELMMAFHKLFTLFTKVVKIGRSRNFKIIKLVENMCFSDNEVTFDTYPFYINLLKLSDFNLQIFINDFHYDKTTKDMVSNI